MMGETDGSSRAAQGALTGDISDEAAAEAAEKTGFIGRLFDALSGSDSSVDGEAAAGLPQTATPGMVNLRRMRVEDVAIPTADIVAIPNTASRDELLRVFRESGLTRIPVYEGTLDNPLGFVHLKDFALIHGFNGEDAPFEMTSMLRDLLFVPPSMTIGVLLTKMQTDRRHMALVIDEYGGVDGLLTIEDVIEQVVGEIDDEHDTAEGQTWLREKTGTYVALAKTPLEEFEAEIGRSLTENDAVDEEEIDTLGGLVFMLSGRVPARGEVVQHPDGPEFEVIDADPRRIKRLRVRLPDPTE